MSGYECKRCDSGDYATPRPAGQRAVPGPSDDKGITVPACLEILAVDLERAKCRIAALERCVREADLMHEIALHPKLWKDYDAARAEVDK